MRKFIVLAAAAVAVLAIPASASANHQGGGCGWIPAGDVITGAGGITAYSGDGTSGNAPVTAAGACWNPNNGAGISYSIPDENSDPTDMTTWNGYKFHGGTAECGTAGGTTAYCIIDGDSRNTDPTGGSDGYIGISNYETGSGTATCDGEATGNGGTNSGGCIGIKDAKMGIPTSAGGAPTPICGDDSGEWHTSQRDGCAIPF